MIVVQQLLVSNKFHLAVSKLVYGRLMSFSCGTRVSKIQARVSSCNVVNYNEKRGGFGSRGRPCKCDERTDEMSIYIISLVSKL